MCIRGRAVRLIKGERDYQCQTEHNKQSYTFDMHCLILGAPDLPRRGHPEGKERKVRTAGVSLGKYVGIPIC